MTDPETRMHGTRQCRPGDPVEATAYRQLAATAPVAAAKNELPAQAVRLAPSAARLEATDDREPVDRPGVAAKLACY
jgi:hypothetical protein